MVTGNTEATDWVQLKINDDLLNTEDAGGIGIFPPFYNRSGDNQNYKYIMKKRLLEEHADKCDPDMKNEMERRENKSLKKIDYGKNHKYPKFKLEMSYNDFERNKGFIFDMLGEEKDKYDMTDPEKQKLVISRMMDSDAKSSLNSIGIDKENLQKNLAKLL